MNKFVEQLEVAFLHPELVLGGAEKVSYDTALLFKQWNIHSTFFTRVLKKDHFPVSPDNYDIEVIPEGKLLSREQVDFMISKIKERNIKVLFIVCGLSEFPVEIREKTGCKLVPWLHSVPLWEVRNKVGRKLSKYRFYPKRAFLPLVNLYLKYRLISYRKKIIGRYQHCLANCDAYIVLCEAYKHFLLHQIPGATEQYADKIFPVINTIPIQENVNLNKKKEIIYMGRLAYSDKRVDRLVIIWQRIWQKLPDWEFKIYGVGEEEAFLRRQIQKLRLERISLEGYAKDPQAIYTEASVLCLTSSFEGVPMAAIEAQNNGVVPVMFDSTYGIRYVIGNGAGVLVPSFNEEEYAHKLYELCSDSVKLEAMRTRCMQKRMDYARNANDKAWMDIFSMLVH